MLHLKTLFDFKGNDFFLYLFQSNNYKHEDKNDTILKLSCLENINFGFF